MIWFNIHVNNMKLVSNILALWLVLSDMFVHEC